MNNNKKRNPVSKRNDDDDDDFDDFGTIESRGNSIYLYDEISRSSMLAFNRSIKGLNLSLAAKANEYNIKVPEIYIYINSFGGSIFDAMAAVDYILESKAPTRTIIDGCAASAATMISIVAKKRYINKHAFMLLHQLSGGAWGKFEEIKDEYTNCNKLMKMIKTLYQEHTKIPSKKLKEILKHDLWLSAKEALHYGIVDEII
jgi:ATP-dependent Clp protease, protease subunit